MPVERAVLLQQFDARPTIRELRLAAGKPAAMAIEPRLDEIARLVGDRSRAAMLSALMDGRAWTGRELARAAHVTPSTASTHLQRLVNGRLLGTIAQGRSRYYRIASAEIARVLESLMVLAASPVPRHPTERRIAAELRVARRCYDHLAGRLGVAIADALVSAGALIFADGTATLTAAGRELFAKLGIAFDERPKRLLCRPCLDWSERRPHLAGIAGAALANAALERNWVQRNGSGRALSVTPAGARALRDALGLHWDAKGA